MAMRNYRKEAIHAVEMIGLTAMTVIAFLSMAVMLT